MNLDGYSPQAHFTKTQKLYGQTAPKPKSIRPLHSEHSSYSSNIKLLTSLNEKLSKEKKTYKWKHVRSEKGQNYFFKTPRKEEKSMNDS